jgi:signal transduction histidine kinase
MTILRQLHRSGFFRLRGPLFVGLILAANATAVAAADLERVTLQLKWKHQFQFAGYYAAIAQGYYRAAGLEVVLREAEPGHDPADAVLNGTADFGVGTSELVLLRAAGKPVVALAAIFQHSPLVLLARHAPGVDDLQGLHNKPLMIEPQSAELFAYFKYEGIDPKTLRVVHHTQRVDELLEGRVEAMSAYSTDEPFLLKEKGDAFFVLSPRAGGIDFYGDNLFTTESQIRARPERVRAFRQASLRGWDYALAHPEEMVDLILRDYSQRKSRAHLLFEAERTSLLMHPGLIEVGHMNPGRWRHMADTYAEFDMLPRGFSLAGFLYDPDPKPDYTWLYWTLAVLAAITLAALGWIGPLIRLNRQLRVAKQAAEAAQISAERANEAKSRYLAFLAHEIRTPLNGLASVVQLLKLDPHARERADTIGVIDQSAKTMLGLLDNVLDYSRIEAGHVEIEPQPLVLGEFLRGLVELYQAPARAKQVGLRLEAAADLPPAILTDALRLRQILANLLANAVKFTANGEVVLTVTSTPAPPTPGLGRSRHLLRFVVADTGVGIAADKLPRLFQPFAQADASVARRFGGSGLGLSISRRLAELLEGTISAESVVGRGSTFTLTLTVEDVPGG